MWPGKTEATGPRRRRPSVISQAVVTAKHGLRNSLGWIDMNGMAIQRRAPLISTPCTRVSAVSPRAAMQPSSASLRTLRVDSSEVPITMPPASARKITCLPMNMSREAPMRVATAGEAASTST